jgi:hypothetical protein
MQIALHGTQLACASYRRFHGFLSLGGASVVL